MLKTSLSLVLLVAGCSKKDEPTSAAAKPVEEAVKPAPTPVAPASATPVEKAPADDGMDIASFKIEFGKGAPRFVPMACLSGIGDHLNVMVGRAKAKHGPCDFSGEDDFDVSFDLRSGDVDTKLPDVGYTAKTKLAIDVDKHAAELPVTLKVVKKTSDELWVDVQADGALPKDVKAFGGVIHVVPHDKGWYDDKDIYAPMKTDANRARE